METVLEIRTGFHSFDAFAKPAHAPRKALQPIEMPQADLEGSGFLRRHHSFHLRWN